MIQPAIALVFLLAGIFPLASQEAGGQDASRRGKVVIFQFKDRSSSSDYAYFSYIIPDSIAVELRQHKAYSVQTFPVTLDFIGEGDSEQKKRNQVLYLSGKGKELAADYTVSGIYEVKDKRISIKSQIFNVEERRILGVEEAGSELGALIFLIIDNLTEKINAQLGGARAIKEPDTGQKIETEEMKAETLAKQELERPEKSPFLPVYHASRGAVLGVEFGPLYLKGEWSDIYSDTVHYAFNLKYGLGNFDIVKHVPVLSSSSVSINYHYFNAIPAEYLHSSLLVRGLSLGYIYEYPLPFDFALYVEGDIGMMFSTLRLYAPWSNEGQGPSTIMEEMHSTDFMTRLLFAAGYTFSPIVFKAGFSINKIWYSDKPMQYYALVFGVGFRI